MGFIEVSSNPMELNGSISGNTRLSVGNTRKNSKYSSGSIKLKKLTNYLGTLVPESVYSAEYNGTQLRKLLPDGLSIIAQYEAVLSQASMMARLSYEKPLIFMYGTQLIKYNPLVFNSVLSLLRSNYDRAEGLKSRRLRDEIEADISIRSGIYLRRTYGISETFCAVQRFDFTKETNPQVFSGKKVLYITFRGTSSAAAGLTDAIVVPGKLMNLYSKCSMKVSKINNIKSNAVSDRFLVNGNEVFSRQTEQGGNFLAHLGFIDNLMTTLPDIVDYLERTLTNDPVDKIIVTGHSLGGANASIAALCLAGFKNYGANVLRNTDLHCITFGAPKIFTDSSRNIFNSFLLDGTMTLDRIAGRTNTVNLLSSGLGRETDLVPLIPPNLVHPGFMILKTEIKTQSRTGRSKNITDLRQMYGGLAPKLGEKFNNQPMYQSFLDCFKSVDGLKETEYRKVMTQNATIYTYTLLYLRNDDVKMIYEGIKQIANRIMGMNTIDISEAETDLAEKQELQNLKGILIEVPSEYPSKTIVPLPVRTVLNGNRQRGSGFFNTLKNKVRTIRKTLSGQSYDYKENTIEMGPNHIVYFCNPAHAAFSCHMAYMGIGYMGGLKSAAQLSSYKNIEILVYEKKVKIQQNDGYFIRRPNVGQFKQG